MTKPTRPALLVDPVSGQTRLRRLATAGLVVSALLSACGGGGGGGGTSDATQSNNTSSSWSTSAAAFPFGLAMGAPTSLQDSSAVVAGGLGITNLGLSATKTLAQGVLSSQADALATGRLSLSGSALLSVNTLFDTSPRGHAACFGPSVGYVNHDDATGTSGTLPSGDVAMWSDLEAGSPSVACGVAELNAQLQGPSAQTQQALLLLAGLRATVVADSTLSMPSAGSTLDLRSRTSTLLSALLTGVTVQAASVSLNADGSEYSYRLVLTRGSGASAQSLDITLLHTPAETDVRYAGTLQLSLAYLSTDASIGCNDQQDGSGRFKVARLGTLGYNRQDQWLSLRARAGQYCGHPTLAGSSHIAELATLTMSGELDPTVSLSGSTRGSTKGWRQGFMRMTQDSVMSTLTSDFIHAWQDQPQGGSGHARMFAGYTTLDIGTQTRTLSLFHGHTDDIGSTDGTLLGLICNVGGPGAMATVGALSQYQSLSLSGSASDWALITSKIGHAPTNNCQASSGMNFDVDGDGTVASGEGASAGYDLLGLSGGSVDIQDELLLMGFLPPILPL